MKRFLGIFLTMIVFFGLSTGCGSKAGETVTCTMAEDGQNITMTATFKDNKATKLVVETSATSSSKEELDQTVAILELSSGMMKAYDGVDAKVSTKDLTATFTMTLNIEKMDKETLETLGFDEVSGTAEEFKKSALESGATCK